MNALEDFRQSAAAIARHFGSTVQIVNANSPATAAAELTATPLGAEKAMRYGIAEDEEGFAVAALDLETAGITKLGANHRLVTDSKQYRIRPVSDAAGTVVFAISRG